MYTTIIPTVMLCVWFIVRPLAVSLAIEGAAARVARFAVSRKTARGIEAGVGAIFVSCYLLNECGYT